MRACIRQALTKLDASIVEASDGAAAVQAFHQHRPDWVLMDVEMPAVDGLTATRQILEITPTARVMILTAFDSSALRNTARKAGACGYVLKSNLDALADLLGGERLIDNSSSHFF